MHALIALSFAGPRVLKLVRLSVSELVGASGPSHLFMQEKTEARTRHTPRTQLGRAQKAVMAEPHSAPILATAPRSHPPCFPLSQALLRGGPRNASGSPENWAHTSSASPSSGSEAHGYEKPGQ